MAEATKVMVTREVTTTITQPGITITLNKDEIDTPMALFYKIAGSPTDSPRAHIKSVADALTSAGAEYPNGRDEDRYGYGPNGSQEALNLLSFTGYNAHFDNYGEGA